MENTTDISTASSNHPDVTVQVEKNSRLKQNIILGVVAVSVAGLSFWALRKMVNNAVSNREENKTLEEGTAPTYAKQLKMAFDNDGWPGTDEEAIRRVMRAMPSKEEFDKVKVSYKKLYHRNLLEDMADELTTSEYNEMLYILSAKPNKKGETVSYNYDAWARRLRAATEQYTMGFWPGTDEDAIYAVFNEIPNYTAYKKVAAAYTKIYGGDLYDDLCGDMWWWEIDDLIAKVKKKGS